jgi:hypothetical protein
LCVVGPLSGGAATSSINRPKLIRTRQMSGGAHRQQCGGRLMYIFVARSVARSEAVFSTFATFLFDASP